MTRCSPILVLAGVLVAVGITLAEDKKPDGIPGVGPTGPVQKMDGKYTFTEGPAVDAEGNVYFSDIPAEKIHKIDTAGKVTVFREKSNHSNGLMVNPKGEVVACEMDGAIVALSADGKDRRVIAESTTGSGSTRRTISCSTRLAVCTSPTPRYGLPRRSRRERRPSITPTPRARSLA